MKVLDSYADFEGSGSSDKQMQLLIYAEKENLNDQPAPSDNGEAGAVVQMNQKTGSKKQEIRRKTMSNHRIIIRPETSADYRTVESLTREAFWNVYRPGCMEHYVLHCYRKAPAFVPELDLVMERDGELIGQVIYVRSEIDCDNGRKVPIMTFGPISIAPAYKRQGYGKQLLDYSMEKAKEMGAGALAITGNIDFYGKSGFVPAKTKGIHYADDPDADYFLIKELTPGFLDGINGSYKDPEGYFVCEKDPEGFEKFEASFPKKEEMKKPGQLFS